jgi:hypothetical protein
MQAQLFFIISIPSDSGGSGSGKEAIPAEFYSDQDARQAIAMTRIVIEAVQVRIGAEPTP